MPYKNPNYQKEYRIKNKEKIKERAREYDRKYRIKNRERFKERNKKYFKEYNSANRSRKRVQFKEYQLKHKKEIQEYMKKWRLDNKIITQAIKKRYYQKNCNLNPLFKLSYRIRSLITNSMKACGYKKTSGTHEILGCDYEFFKAYIESKFQEGMSWDNSGKWHYDHIIPISSAKTEEEVYRLNKYTNFQPLWALDNLRKGKKIIEKQLVLI